MHPHHHGFLGFCRQALSPDILYLTVLVFHPVTVRKNDIIRADGGGLRDRTNGTPYLSALGTFPCWNGLRHLEAVRLCIRDAKKGEDRSVFQAAEFPPLIWTTGGCRFGASTAAVALAASCVWAFGCSMALALPAASASPPAVARVSRVRRLIASGLDG